MGLPKAVQYMKQVIAHTRAIAMRRHKRGVGRHAQSKEFSGAPNVRWPRKSCEQVLSLLKNLKANAEVKEIDPKTLKIVRVQVQRAPPGRRRTYRAHGRIGPYMSHPCHIQLQ